MQFFVLRVASNKEDQVREKLARKVKIEALEEFVGRILVPTERVRSMKGGVRRESDRKLYPGYVFVDMILLDDNKRIVEKPWYFIRDTPGIIGFVGGDRPTPTSQEEIATIKEQISESEDQERPKVNFEAGETIKINDGPFLNFSGVIEEIEPERGKLKVTVNIFGRNTPVELEYWQVEKA